MIEAVTLHPPVAEFFGAYEHAEGELKHLGDALGVDVQVAHLTERGWAASYRGDGSRNEDWFAWNVRLLAPLRATVESVRTNAVTNVPGIMGEPPASAIQFLSEDGTRVVYGHVQDVQVAEGDQVEPGDFVARIGNNGMCRNPHVHIGAWQGDTPLQVRFDLAALGAARRESQQLQPRTGP